MPVYKNLKAIRKLSNSSLTSIIDITNLNFRSLSDANLEFLSNIQYDETLNSFQVYRGTFDFVNITDTLSLTLDGIPTFTINSLGNAEGQTLLVKVAETKRLRLTDFNDWPDIGVPGEIIYTGIQNQRPEFGEDFIGYLQGQGWVSLTDKGGNGTLLLKELAGSPPIPACPAPNTGVLWIGPPGYATQYTPTTQSLYYTDENCDIFDLTTDFIWEKLGNDGKFKLPGKVIIGDTTNTRQLQYVDGNQTPGYVLTSDAFGNASWQPSNGGGGGGGGACSYVLIQSFTANVTQTITHNLGTSSIIVQLIRTDTNELIEAYIDNYTPTTVDITLTQSIIGIKIVILAAGCSGGTGDAGHKKYIYAAETLTVLQDYQYFIYGNLTVAGTVNNYGEVTIANGNLNVLPGGQFNNLGVGILTVVNLATGISMQVVIRSFTTTAMIPININHGLGTKDFTYTVRDGDTLIDVDIVHVDTNNITLMTTASVTGGSIVFQAKI